MTSSVSLLSTTASATGGARLVRAAAVLAPSVPHAASAWWTTSPSGTAPRGRPSARLPRREASAALAPRHPRACQGVTHARCRKQVVSSDIVSVREEFRLVYEGTEPHSPRPAVSILRLTRARTNSRAARLMLPFSWTSLAEDREAVHLTYLQAGARAQRPFADSAARDPRSGGARRCPGPGSRVRRAGTQARGPAAPRLLLQGDRDSRLGAVSPACARVSPSLLRPRCQGQH